MPSGAKKRKAAKKKMVEKGNNNNNYATHSHVLVNDQAMEGDDEPKQQPSFTEEGEKQESRSTVRSNVSESNAREEINHDGENMQKGAMEEDFVHIEREGVKSLEDFNGNISTIDNEKESHDSSSSESSTSSSSEDESHDLEKVETGPSLDSNKQIDYTPKEVIQEIDAISPTEVNHSIKETANFVESDKIVIHDYAIESNDDSSDDDSPSLEKEKVVDSNEPINSSYQEEIQVTDVVNPFVEEFGSTVESDKDLEEKKVEETAPTNESHVLDEKTGMDEIAPPVDSINIDDSLSKAVTRVNDVNPSEEFNNLVEETESVLASINVPMLKSIVHGNGSASVDNSVTSCEVVEYVSNENGEKKHISMDEIAIPSTMMDVGSQNQVVESGLKENGEKNFPSMASSVEHTVKDSVVRINEDESSLPFIAPKVGTSNGEERVESDTHGCSDSQPLVDSARRTVQTTSWKGCCGIFELFTAGN